MKEMIKRIREEKGGFTLAELLIVVAIILVLVAIAVPVFTGALNDAQRAANEGNISNVKSVAAMNYMNAEYKTAGTGANAVNGTYYIDKNKDVVKADTEPEGALDGPIYVKATAPVGGSGDVKIEVSRDPIS